MARTRAGTQVVLFARGPSVSPPASPSPMASGLGLAEPQGSSVAPSSLSGSQTGYRAGGLLGFTASGDGSCGEMERAVSHCSPSLPPSLPWQMSTSAWRAPTTATSTPSARTPPSPTSASASLATPVTGSTAKVGARRSPASALTLQCAGTERDVTGLASGGGSCCALFWAAQAGHLGLVLTKA